MRQVCVFNPATGRNEIRYVDHGPASAVHGHDRPTIPIGHGDMQRRLPVVGMNRTERPA